jgi:hypothetical protein
MAGKRTGRCERAVESASFRFRQRGHLLSFIDLKAGIRHAKAEPLSFYAGTWGSAYSGLIRWRRLSAAKQAFAKQAALGHRRSGEGPNGSGNRISHLQYCDRSFPSRISRFDRVDAAASGIDDVKASWAVNLTTRPTIVAALGPMPLAAMQIWHPRQGIARSSENSLHTREREARAARASHPLWSLH